MKLRTALMPSSSSAVVSSLLKQTVNVLAIHKRVRWCGQFFVMVGV